MCPSARQPRSQLLTTCMGPRASNVRPETNPSLCETASRYSLAANRCVLCTAETASPTNDPYARTLRSRHQHSTSCMYQMYSFATSLSPPQDLVALHVCRRPPLGVYCTSSYVFDVPCSHCNTVHRTISGLIRHPNPCTLTLIKHPRTHSDQTIERHASQLTAPPGSLPSPLPLPGTQSRPRGPRPGRPVGVMGCAVVVAVKRRAWPIRSNEICPDVIGSA